MTAALLSAESRCRWFSSWRYRWARTPHFHLLTNKVMKTVSACQWPQLVWGRAEFMESSGACNLKGAVSREAAIAAPIIKLLWSPARESEAERRGGGREEKRKRKRKERVRQKLESGGPGCKESLVLRVVHARKPSWNIWMVRQKQNNEKWNAVLKRRRMWESSKQSSNTKTSLLARIGTFGLLNTAAMSLCVFVCVRWGGGPELGLAFVFGSSGKQRLAQPLKPPPGNTKWQRGSWCHITSGQPSLSPSTCHFIGIPPLCPSRARTCTRHTHTCVKRVLNFSYLHSDTHRRVRLGVDPFFCFSRGDTCVRCYSSTNTHTRDSAQTVTSPFKQRLSKSNEDSCVCRLVWASERVPGAEVAHAHVLRGAWPVLEL